MSKGRLLRQMVYKLWGQHNNKSLQKTCGILQKGENRSTLVQVGVHYYQERFKGKENNVLLPKSV